MAGQVGDLNPGQDEKPAIIGCQAKIVSSFFLAPANEGVPVPAGPGGGAEEETSQNFSTSARYQVGHAFTYEAVKAKIMVLVQEGFELT